MLRCVNEKLAEAYGKSGVQSKLYLAEIANHGVVKTAILEEYELVTEVYRLKFRACTKRSNESYAYFVHFMSIQFECWNKLERVDNFASFNQVMLMEQFSDKILHEVKKVFVGQ
jgi:hypothetical protein